MDVLKGDIMSSATDQLIKDMTDIQLLMVAIGGLLSASPSLRGEEGRLKRAVQEELGTRATRTRHDT